jgi:RHS repeat-associated protein
VLLDDGTRKYVWGAGGLACATDEPSNVQAVYQTDGLGSESALTDGTGTLVQTYHTDAFGVPTPTQGSSTQPFGFTGESVEPNGLVNLRARLYDPTIGRFVQRDPLTGSIPSPGRSIGYTCVISNPSLLVDHSGLSPFE